MLLLGDAPPPLDRRNSHSFTFPAIRSEPTYSNFLRLPSSEELDLVDPLNIHEARFLK